MYDNRFCTGHFLLPNLNYAKSHCMMFGNCIMQNTEPMYTGGHCINWVESLEYLGVNVTIEVEVVV
jgi:hypothetical protein